MMQCIQHDLTFLMLETVPQNYRWEQTSPVWTHLRLPSKASLQSILGEAILGDFILLSLLAIDEPLSPPFHRWPRLLALHSFISGHNVLLKKPETSLPVFRELLLAFHLHSHHNESIFKISKSIENFLNDLWRVCVCVSHIVLDLWPSRLLEVWAVLKAVSWEKNFHLGRH